MPGWHATPGGVSDHKNPGRSDAILYDHKDSNRSEMILRGCVD